ncbi:hypothetical protein Tco_0751360 [Tanacetum coccineum]|uniref:Uncharacterized protein n=1 Tax=Tanacetum coccineum TaxID=301880 RepID=A0ABQ4Z3V1_9ASTR
MGPTVIPGQETTLPHVFTATTLYDFASGAWNFDIGASSHPNNSVNSLSEIFNTCISLLTSPIPQLSLFVKHVASAVLGHQGGGRDTSVLFLSMLLFVSNNVNLPFLPCLCVDFTHTVTHPDANMAFDLRPTEDVLPWPGNANMAFDLRPTEDVLPWPASEVVMTKERMSAALVIGTCRADKEHHRRTESMTADTEKENMSGRAEYRGKTADTKKENMPECAEYRGRTTNTKKENITGQKHR